jgi:hypothetical protein
VSAATTSSSSASSSDGAPRFVGFSFTTDDIVESLKRSANLNAALKHFLKREVRRGDLAERFVKDLREVFAAKDPTRALGFIEKKRPAFDSHLVAIGGYAHGEIVMAIANEIVEKYADSFNATYAVVGEDIEVRDSAGFDKIVGEAVAIVTARLTAAGFRDSPFMQGVVLATVFDRPVLRYLLAER